MVKIKLVSLDNPPIIQTSSQAVPLPQILGRMQIEGQVIWADDFKIVNATKKDDQTGEGFSLSFAIALCAGEINHISKIWANGQAFDLEDINWRYYKGSATQPPDALLENSFGIGKAPAFRDVAYVIFEDLHLAQFGNMVPKFSFEVINAIGALENQIKALSIIPGATEFGYDTVAIIRETPDGLISENEHGFLGKTDFLTSIDELCHLCPNLKQISLIVPWFGDDLRASNIKIMPCVDDASKYTQQISWKVGNITRASAKMVSQVNGHSAFGGTPSDQSIRHAITEFTRRNIRVTFYPFIMMDIAANNNLPNPYGGVGQPIYPWRGRITCNPAIGYLNSPDQSLSAKNQVDAFFGAFEIEDFSIIADEIIHNISIDWGYRRMILHYAYLCALSGGVSNFLIGSELVGLTKIRDSRTSFPAVAELKRLAADVKTILLDCKISYGADWSEYFGYHPQDATGDVFFHLDPLWADANIAAVGIDAYWPLSDFRENDWILDAAQDISHDITNQILTEKPNIYDQQSLQNQIRSGEGFDYYYATFQARIDKQQTPIIDTAYGRDWVFRNKDIKSWWMNSHYNRIDGVEVASPTAWIPQSKPIWLTEMGCPAIDKGSNQPNVFYDPISSEGKIPYFSNNTRDDAIQRAYLQAFLEYYQQSSANNPISNLYHDTMIDVSNIFIWAYDARPYPYFPLLKEVWADGDNWNYGHWLNGRLGAVPLKELISLLAENIKVNVTKIVGQVEGYIIDSSKTNLENLKQIANLFDLKMYFVNDIIIFEHLHRHKPLLISDNNIVLADNPPNMMQDRDNLPTDIYLKYISDDGHYSTKISSELLDQDIVNSDVRSDVQYSIDAVLSEAMATQIVSHKLANIRQNNQQLKFEILARYISFDIGDIVEFKQSHIMPLGHWKIINIKWDMTCLITAISLNYNGQAQPLNHGIKKGSVKSKLAQGRANMIALDLPYIKDITPEYGLALSAYTKPWTQNIAVFTKVGGNYVKQTEIKKPAMLGQLISGFDIGIIHKIDAVNKPIVKLKSGNLTSISLDQLLYGLNLAAIKKKNGQWEVFQFQNATLIATKTYQLSQLIRGKFDTGHLIKILPNEGADFILLNQAIVNMPLVIEELNTEIPIKYGPKNKPISNVNYQQKDWLYQGVALKPFAPVHAKIHKLEEGLLIKWIRQTRHSGESWVLQEVPLNEEFEAYEISIINPQDHTEIRKMTSTIPSILYSDAWLMADFGGADIQFIAKIYQISALMGRGNEKEISYNVQ